MPGPLGATRLRRGCAVSSPLSPVQLCSWQCNVLCCNAVLRFSSLAKRCQVVLGLQNKGFCILQTSLPQIRGRGGQK